MSARYEKEIDAQSRLWQEHSTGRPLPWRAGAVCTSGGSWHGVFLLVICCSCCLHWLGAFQNPQEMKGNFQKSLVGSQELGFGEKEGKEASIS